MKSAFLTAPGKDISPVRYTIHGIVEHGDARGRRIGFPTANIPAATGSMPEGVWSGTAEICSGSGVITYAAAVSVGRRPTYYGEGKFLVEAHLLDFAGILYGEVLRVNLHAHIRGQRAFQNSDELTTQIENDVLVVRSWWTEQSEQVLSNFSNA